MEQNRVFRNRCTHIWSIDFQQRYKGNSVQKERIVFKKNSAEIMGHPQVNKTEQLKTKTDKQNQTLKMNHGTKYKIQYYTTSRQKHRRKSL